MAQKRIQAIDGLRGLAAITVVYSHAFRDFGAGSLAVEVFFVISGFLVGGVLLDEVGSPDWVGRFYVRRTARIWPMYFLACAVILLTDRFVPWPTHVPWWSYFTFTFGTASAFLPSLPRESTRPLWSIGVEEFGYVVLPVVIAKMKRADLPRGLLAIAAGSIGMRYLVGNLPAHAIWPAYVFPPARLDGMCFGVLAAWAVRERVPVTGKAPVLAALLCGLRFGHFEGWLGMSLWDCAVIQTIGSVGIAILLAVLAGQGLPTVARVLAWRPFQLLGRYSFTLYLFHSLALDAIIPAARPILNWLRPWPFCYGAFLFVNSAAVTLAFAALTWRFIESPLIAWSRRYGSGAGPVPEDVTASRTKSTSKVVDPKPGLAG